MKAALILALAALATTAQADEWTGADKKLHLAVGAAIGVVGAASFDKRTGFLLGAGVGLAKEIYDSRNRDRHTVSAKDFAVTAVGAFAGAYVPGLVLGRRSISYSFEF